MELSKGVDLNTSAPFFRRTTQCRGCRIQTFNTESLSDDHVTRHSASGTNISPRLTQISPENFSKPGCKYTLIDDGLETRTWSLYRPASGIFRRNLNSPQESKEREP
jgi:hypothetical protein